MKLSIIIAMYNTEMYIEKCIRSVYENNSLDLNSFEVIVINDGSTDGSQYIVEQLKNEFSNITLVNKINGGQSSARNIGFKIAKGDYLFCLDSDDSINSEMLEELLNFCYVNNLDILGINLKRISETNLELSRGKDDYLETEKPMSGGDFLNRFTISGAMCRYFYKTALIKKNNLRLIEGIYHEDEEFVIQVFSYSERVQYLNFSFYNYLIHSNSTTNNLSKTHRIKLLNDIITVIKSLDELANSINDVAVKKGIDKKKQQLVLSVFLRMYKDKLDRDVVHDIILILKKENLYPLKTDKLSWKQQAVGAIINKSYVIDLIYKKNM